MIALVLIALAVSGCTALFAEQAGVEDWYHASIGRVTDAAFHTKRRTTFVVTDSSVLASIKLGSGAILWRQVLPEGESLDLLRASQATLVTLSDGGQITRCWTATDGTLLWETGTHKVDKSVTRLSHKLRPRPARKAVGSGDDDFDVAFVTNKDLSEYPMIATLANNAVTLRDTEGNTVWAWEAPADAGTCRHLQHALEVVLVHCDSGLLTYLDAKTGKEGSTATLAVPKTATAVVLKQALVFLDRASETLTLVDLRTAPPAAESNLALPAGVNVDWASATISAMGNEATSFSLSSPTGTVVLDVSTLSCADDSSATCKASTTPTLAVLLKTSGSAPAAAADNGAVVLFANPSAKASADILAPGSADPTSIFSGDDFATKGGAERVWLHAQPSKNGVAYHLLVSARDDSLSIITAGKVVWLREESLASVTHTLFVDLPAGVPTDGQYPGFASRIAPKLAFLGSTANAIPAFAKSSLGMLQAIIADISGAKPELKTLARDFSQVLAGGKPAKLEMTPHTFGFRKLLLTATQAGTVIGFDSLTGQIVWTKFLGEEIRGMFKDADGLVTLLTRAPNAGGDSILTLHAISGETASPARRQTLAVEQILSPPLRDNTGAQVLLLIHNETADVTVFPDSASAKSQAKAHATKVFFHRTSISESKVTGYRLVVSATGIIQTQELWAMALPADREKISSVATRNAEEVVHSSVRITSAKTFLQKYLNPNVLVLATVREAPADGLATLASVKRSPDPCVNIYVLDGVTGRILEKFVHRGGTGPVQLIVAENNVVYQYFNAQSHSHEISVLEMFEGEDDLASAQDSTFSSLTSGIPLIEQQTYVLRSGGKALGVTRTTRGIAHKMFLLGLESDQVLSIASGMLDPQRPAGEPSESDKFQQLMKYIPEIPSPPQAILSHTRVIHNLREIVSEPVELESTSLVLAIGLDLFHSRVQASGAFDLLNDDFNYVFLVLSLVSLAVLIAFTFMMAEKKVLSEAWR